MSDYLWDPNEPPDPEVENLERLLAPLAHRASELRPLPPLPLRRSRVMWISLGLAASAALALLLVLRPWRPVVAPAPRAGWAMSVTGSARADGKPISGAGQLPVGVWLETDNGQALLQVADIGTVELSPGARAQIVESGPRKHELRLDHGTLLARVTAPPRLFLVETRFALVVDLGCEFKLTVDESGKGELVVIAGSVALSSEDGETVVPAGGKWAIHEPTKKSEPPTKKIARPTPPTKKTAPPTQPKKSSQPQTQTQTQTPPTQTRTSTPTKTSTQTRTPTKDSSPRLSHDALKDLDRSAP